VSGYVNWSKGYQHEYELVEEAMNTATEPTLRKFVRLLRTERLDLMDAHFTAFFGGSHPRLGEVNDCWFGASGSPMWLWDCTVAPEQIHAIMREARARTAELLLAGAGPVEMWVQCGHPRFHTEITWQTARPEDATPAVGIESWAPAERPALGPVRVWVYTPFNSGYSMDGSTEHYEASKARRQELIELVNGGARPRDVMTYEDVSFIGKGFRAGSQPWRRTPLAVRPKGYPADPAGIDVTFLPPRAEPPRSALGTKPPQMLARTVAGIRLDWRGAGRGVIVGGDAEPAPSPNGPGSNY